MEPGSRRTWTSRQPLEQQFESQLHDAGIAGGRDRAKARRAQDSVRSAKRRRVEQVEDLRAELQGTAGPKRYSPNQREIDIPVRRSANRIARCCANCELRGDGKCR